LNSLALRDALIQKCAANCMQYPVTVTVIRSLTSVSKLYTISVSQIGKGSSCF